MSSLAARGDRRDIIHPMARPPVVKSFVIADTVIQDRMSGKWSIIGVFDRIMAPAFPVFHPIAVYLKLGDAQGRYQIKIELRDSSDRRIAMIEGSPIDAPGPALEVGFRAPPIPLEKPGSYQFQLFVNGEFLASAPLDLVQVQLPNPPAPPAPPV